MYTLREILWYSESLATLVDRIRVFHKTEDGHGSFVVEGVVDTDDTYYIAIYYHYLTEYGEPKVFEVDFVPATGTPKELSNLGLDLEDMNWHVDPDDLCMAEFKVNEVKDFLDRCKDQG